MLRIPFLRVNKSSKPFIFLAVFQVSFITCRKIMLWLQNSAAVHSAVLSCPWNKIKPSHCYYCRILKIEKKNSVHWRPLTTIFYWYYIWVYMMFYHMKIWLRYQILKKVLMWRNNDWCTRLLFGSSSLGLVWQVKVGTMVCLCSWQPCNTPLLVGPGTCLCC